MGPQGTRGGNRGKLGGKQKTQRGFMYPLNIAMGMDVYSFEEEKEGVRDGMKRKGDEMYSH